MKHNPYEWLAKLQLPDNCIVVADAGSAFYFGMTAVPLREGMRYITNGAQGDMGAAIPLAIGAAFAAPGREVVVITGDGSFGFQVQHLPTIWEYGLRIYIFVLCNDGYLSVKGGQDKFCERRRIGVEPSMDYPEHPFVEYVDIDPSIPVRKPVL
jgi:acetolactate synthase-1/2/3 large subunit